MVRKSAAKKAKAKAKGETGCPRKTPPPAAPEQQVQAVKKKTTETESNTKSLKEQGNDHFKANRVEEALSCYIQALAGGGLNKQEKAILYKNKVACFLKMGRNKEAIVDATTALEMFPKDPKALFRRCQAYENLGNIHEAMHDAVELRSNAKWTKSIESTSNRLMKATGFIDLVEQGYFGKDSDGDDNGSAGSVSGVDVTGKINTNGNSSSGPNQITTKNRTSSSWPKLIGGCGTHIAGIEMKKYAQDNNWENVIHLLNIVDDFTKLEEEVIREVMFEAVSKGNLFIVQKMYLLCAFYFNSSACVERCVKDDGEENSLDFKTRMLHTAASKGFIDILRYLVSLNKLLIEEKDKDGNTLLHLCQSSPSAVGITRYLLSINVNVNIQNKNGETSLMKAVQNRNVKTMILLFEKGADFHFKDKEGNNVFDIEKRYGMERFLTTISYATFKGHCPVTAAAMDRDFDVLELLLMAKHYPIKKALSSVIDPIVEEIYKDFRYSKELHPYCKLRSNPHIPMEENEYFNEKEVYVMDLLVRGGANIYKNSPKVSDKQLLHQFCGPLRMSCPLIEAVKVSDWYLVELMIQCQSFESVVRNKDIFLRAYDLASTISASNISIEDNFLFSVVTVPIQKLVQEGKLDDMEIEHTLYSSIRGGNDEMATELFEQIEKVDFKAVLKIAAESGKTSSLVMLKNAGGEEFEKQISQNGLELLEDACSKDNSAMVNRLIELGVQPQSVDKNSKYQPVLKAKSAKVLELLLDASVDLDASHVNCNGKSSTLRRLVAEYAVRLKSVDMIKMLLRFGSKVDAKLICYAFSDDAMRESITNRFRNLPDGDQRSEKNTTFFEFLEEFAKDLDLNYLKEGRSVLSWAAQCGRKTFVESLIKLGADVNFGSYQEDLEQNSDIETAQNVSKYIPIVCAAMRGHTDIVELLLAKGALVDSYGMVNTNGMTEWHSETALYIACEHGYTDVVSLLIKKGANMNVKIEEDWSEEWPLSIAAKNGCFKIFCALVDAGADLTLMKSGKHSLTVISHLLRSTQSSFDRQKFIVYIFEHGSQVKLIHSKEVMFTIHRSIALKDIELLKILISKGGFSPVLMDKATFFCKVKKTHDYTINGDYHVTLLEDLDGVFSPLCMALLSDQVDLAQELYSALYITTSDLFLLPEHQKLKETLSKRNLKKSLKFLEKISASVPTLMQISFAATSELVGSQLQRKKVVAGLDIPLPLKKQLLFENADQRIDYTTVYKKKVWRRWDGISSMIEDEDQYRILEEDYEYEPRVYPLNHIIFSSESEEDSD